jgi:hypothetical protein
VVIANGLLAPERGLLEGQLEVPFEVPLVSASNAEDPEQIAENTVDRDVADIHDTPGKRTARRKRRTGLLGAVAEPIVVCASVPVRQYLVGEIDLLEAFLRPRVPLILVRVIRDGQALESALDLLGGRVASDSEHLVVVPLRHASVAWSSIPVAPALTFAIAAPIASTLSHGSY